LIKILAIWASVTVPMALLAWVVGPAIIPHTSLHPGLVHWMLMVVGMMWQFVVSLAVLRHELGGLHWPTLKKRIWLNLPRDPRTGKTRKALFLWVVPAVAANVLGGYLATRLDTAWTNWLPFLHEPSYTNFQGLADPKFQGQWWILGLAITSMLFNYILGEELLFRGVLLPRMSGVFGRWDWVANTVLFGLYHVHKIWAWPSMIASSFGYAWATEAIPQFLDGRDRARSRGLLHRPRCGDPRWLVSVSLSDQLPSCRGDAFWGHAVAIKQEAGRAGWCKLWNAQDRHLGRMSLHHRLGHRAAQGASDSGFLGSDNATRLPGSPHNCLRVQRLHRGHGDHSCRDPVIGELFCGNESPPQHRAIADQGHIVTIAKSDCPPGRKV
jgi:membrane protease YdiL (CAAX protease family)